MSLRFKLNVVMYASIFWEWKRCSVHLYLYLLCMGLVLHLRYSYLLRALVSNTIVILSDVRVV